MNPRAPNPRDRLAPVREGDLLAGKYRVERVLGVGGMGVVVAARHEALRQRVALKFLLPDVAAEPEAVERFGREARAMASLRGEHVARALDVGTLESGAPYYVMEYLEGEDLARACQRRGPLPVVEAVGYVLQTCEALAEAHRLGMVHRDLKPANLFLTRGVDGAPVVKVLDFGVSKVLTTTRGEGFDLTATSALMGSPRYMAPEQLRDARRVDPRADIWSLGVVLHELLAAESPFAAETLPELHVAILQGAPRPLRPRRPDVPPALEAVAARCLAKDPAARYPHVVALADALAPFGPPSAAAAVARIASVLGLAPPGASLARASGVPPQSAAGPHAGSPPRATTALVTPHPSMAASARAPATLATPAPSVSSLAAGGAAAPWGRGASHPPAGAPQGAGPPHVAHPAYAPAAPARRVAPATVAATPAPEMFDGRAAPGASAPLAHAPAPVPVPIPFEGSWGPGAAPLAPTTSALAPRGPNSSSRTLAALALITLAVIVSFGGCVVCAGVGLGL